MASVILALFTFQQLFTPLSLLSPALATAQEQSQAEKAQELKQVLNYDSETHTFSIAFASNQPVNYVLVYNRLATAADSTADSAEDSEESLQEAVQGEMQPVDGWVTAEVLAGTCSTTECSYHQIVDGSLELIQGEESAKYEFTFENGTFKLKTDIAAAKRKPLNQDKKAKASKKPYLDGEVLVKFKPAEVSLKSESGDKKVASFLNDNKYKLKKNIPDSNLVLVELPKGQTVEKALELLAKDKRVEYVEPNYVREPKLIATNDTHKDLLWGLHNEGQWAGVYGTSDADIDAPEAWVTTEGAGAIVAVVDTGVAYNHVDLQGNMWNGASCVDDTGAALGGCIHGYDYEDDDADPFPTSSDHGTHVAGTIAAIKNNSEGVIGVAPQAKIMALKFGGNVADEVQAINFARHNGAKILNASFGGSGFSLAESDALAAFGAAGGLVVAAAGNNASNNDLTPHYPSDLPLSNLISVAATDQNDQLASFSNYGATAVDLGAPGVDVYSTVPDLVFSTPLTQSFDTTTSPGLPTGWTTTGNFGTFATGNAGWGSVLYGDIVDYPYAQSANWTATAPSVDLEGSNLAEISFYAVCDTQYSSSNWYDYMALEISKDGGANYTEIGRWDEYSIDMTNGDPADAAGSAIGFLTFYPDSSYLVSNFMFRFRWIANGDTDTGSVGDGCAIDDVTVTSRYFAGGGGGSYPWEFKDGTSMAAPHVAGAAALIESCSDPLTAEEIKQILLDTVDPKASLASKTVTGGRLNANSAVTLACPPNQPPVLDAITNPSGNELTNIGFTATATDPDSDPLTFSLTGTIPAGAGIDPSTGVFSWIPTEAQGPGSYVFTVAVSDGQGNSDTQQITVTVSEVNLTPVGATQSATTSEDTALNISLFGSDGDYPLQNLVYSITIDPVSGTLVASGSNWLYTPDLNFFGIDSFWYELFDGVATSPQYEITINVTAQNDAPVANNDPLVTTNEDTMVTINPVGLLSNDIDVDGDVLTITSVQNPSNGTVSINGGGQIEFTPNLNFNGIASFEYTISDGVLTDTAVVTITVAAINDQPTVAPIATATEEDIAIDITLLGNDVDGDSLSYQITAGPTNGSVSLVGNIVTYTPNLDYIGSDSFTYMAEDASLQSAPATVSIEVTPYNDPPVMDSLTNQIVDEGTLLSITATSTDIDGPTTIYSLVGTIPAGIAIDPTTGILTWTPTEAQGPGVYTVQVKVEDGALVNKSDQTSLQITVNEVNAAPVANDQSVTAQEDVALPITLDVLDNDLPANTLTFSLITAPVNGAVSISAAGVATYLSDLNYNGLDSFTYEVTDGLGGVATASAYLTVQPQNDAPIANDDPFVSTNEDTTVVINQAGLLANDSDIDGDSITITAVSNPTNGTVSLNSFGEVVFTPAANFTGDATFVYTVSDGSLTDSAVVTVTVAPINDAPVAANQSVVVIKNTPQTFGLTVSDVDGDVLTVVPVINPLNGTITINGLNVTYTPNLDYLGADSFTYYAYDPSTESSQEVTVSLNVVKPAPVVTGGSGSTGTASSGGSNAGGSAQKCIDNRPTGVPTLLQATANQNGQVTLTWTQVTDLFSHYGLVYGTSANKVEYGQLNFAPSTATSAVVSNLVPGVTYYFQVMAVNGCMVGELSNQVASGQATNQPFRTFNETEEISQDEATNGEVLGESNEIATIAANSDSSSTAKTCDQPAYFWVVILLLLQLGVLLISEVLLGQNVWLKRAAYIVTTLASVLLFILLRDWQCFAGNWFFELLFRGYPVVAVLESIGVSLFAAKRK